MSAGDRMGQSGHARADASEVDVQHRPDSQLTLFDGGKTFADIKRSKPTSSAAEAAEVNTEFNVALQVKQAYNAMLAAKEPKRAARAQLAAPSSSSHTSIAKVTPARRTSPIRSAASCRSATRSSRLLTAQNTFARASAALTRLVGTPYFVTADPADTVDHTVAPIDSAAVMGLALDGPAIRQNQAQITAASARRSAKAAYLPDGSTANFNYSGTARPAGMG